MLSLDPAVIDRSSPIPAERRLWVAVLRQAVCDLGYHRSTFQHFTRLWFESDKREPGSFLWVCAPRPTVPTCRRYARRSHLLRPHLPLKTPRVNCSSLMSPGFGAGCWRWLTRIRLFQCVSFI